MTVDNSQVYPVANWIEGGFVLHVKTTVLHCSNESLAIKCHWCFKAMSYSSMLNGRGVSSCCTNWSDGLRNCRKRVRNPVALLGSLSDRYPWVRYKPPYPLSYGSNSTYTVLEGWLWITYKGWYAIKQRNKTKPLR